MLSSITQAMGVSVEDLFACHTKQVLENMGGSYQSWTVHSVEQQVFDTLLSRAGECKEFKQGCHGVLISKIAFFEGVCRRNDQYTFIEHIFLFCLIFSKNV